MSAKEFNRAMGSLIRRQRLMHGLTMQAVAQQLGFSYQQQSKYEHGQNACTAQLVAKYAALFGISVAVFYELVIENDSEPTGADNDAFLAARYVARMKDEKTRAAFVYFARQVAERGGGA